MIGRLWRRFLHWQPFTTKRFMWFNVETALIGRRVREEQLQAQLAAVRAKLESIVCTDEIDRGVVLLNHEGGTHIEVIGGREVTVYNHEHFSPLGDALIELWELTKGKE